jgi:hypothetical protein
MYNLPTVTADYTTTTLSLTPSQTLPVVGSKSQVIHEMDDGSVSVISESDTSTFEVTCQWNTLTAEEHATVLDFWHNPLKANGMERTFKWLHPITEVTYVVRFMTDLTSQHKDNPYKDIGSITLLVEGISA